VLALVLAIARQCRADPDGYSVNARCLDEGTVKEMRVIPFDGVNWEKNAAALAHKSKE
jgi:hypothetical protein